jgi:hypothetical protein
MAKVNVDKVINKVHDSRIDFVVNNIRELSPRKKKALNEEFNRNPDNRFSDAVLVACSYLFTN